MKRVICVVFLFLLLAGCSAPAGYTEDDLNKAYQRGYSDGMADAQAEVDAAPSRAFGAEESTVTVYITKGGDKYHAAGCQYLRKSCIPVDLEVAKEYYSPCSTCKPPR